jgi:SAM-dependent methyltransferase
MSFLTKFYNKIYQGIKWRIRRRRYPYQDFLFDILSCGAYLGKTYETKYKQIGAQRVGSTGVWVLSYIFNKIYQIGPEEVLVDVGCGKGRVILWWLKKGYKNKIYGIEIDEKTAAETQARFSKYANVRIITGNIIENMPQDGTLFYLFNPSKGNLMMQFEQKLREQFRERKNVTIIYYNCQQIEVFEKDENWEISIVRRIDSSDDDIYKKPWLAIIRMR